MDTNYPVLNELMEFSQGNYEAQVTGLVEMFETYSKVGQSGLTLKQFHHADNNHDIYQFRRGDIRVMCFKDEGGLVLLCSAKLKGGTKADKKQVKKAIKLKSEYFREKGANNLNRETLL